MTAPEGTAEVIVTGRVLHRGHIAVPGTVIAAIPEAEADMLVACGVAELYRG